MDLLELVLRGGLAFHQLVELEDHLFDGAGLGGLGLVAPLHRFPVLGVVLERTADLVLVEDIDGIRGLAIGVVGEIGEDGEQGFGRGLDHVEEVVIRQTFLAAFMKPLGQGGLEGGAEALESRLGHDEPANITGAFWSANAPLDCRKLAVGVSEPPNSKASADPTRVDLGATLASADAHPPARDSTYPSGATPLPVRIGRFTVLERLGQGGMGMVFAAYDVELDRKLAIKLLLPDQGTRGLRARLQREAQAMAKLSHPNVVHVYEVGEHEGQVFIAMEFVRGQTLADWLEKEQRGLEEIVVAFCQAGRGLAAAHQAGLIHRDFKPENVMVGDDGRIRVLDFGLAAEQLRDSRAEAKVEAEAATEVHAKRVSLTRTGAIMGTPAFMSPEQHLGFEVGPASDQFSFCVALYNALLGQAPFEGDSLAALMISVTGGELQPPPSGHGVPKPILAALTRGLSTKPDERFADMDTLLEQLEMREQGRPRWPALVLVLLVAFVVAAIVQLRQREQPGTACERAGDKLATIWTDSREAAIGAGFANTGLAYANDTWARVQPDLRAYADGWIAARREACEATHVDRAQSGELLDRRMRCLDERMAEFAAALELLEDPDTDIVRNATSMIPALNGLERCSAASVLAREDPDAGLAPDVAAQRSALLATLAKADALYDAGKYDGGIGLAEPALAQAQAAGLDVVEARALFLLGLLRERGGFYVEAQAELERAYFLALRHGEDELATEVSCQLVFVIGARQARHAEGLAWEYHSRALLARLPESEHVRNIRASLDNNVGVVLKASGDFAGARESYTRSLTLARARGDGYSMAKIFQNLALVSRSLGENEGARREIAEALGFAEQALGSGHPELILVFNTAGLIANDSGDVEGARGYYERAVAIGGEALGREHPVLAHPLNNLGALCIDAGDYPAARGYLERAIALYEAGNGRRHVSSSIAVFNLAELARLTESHAEAIELYEETLIIDAAAYGEDDPSLAHANLGIAVSAQALGDFKRARVELERIAELGVRAEAEGKALDGVLVVEAEFARAKLTLVADGDRQEATRLAHAAHASGTSEQQDEISEWLREEGLEQPG